MTRMTPSEAFVETMHRMAAWTAEFQRRLGEDKLFATSFFSNVSFLEACTRLPWT